MEVFIHYEGGVNIMNLSYEKTDKYNKTLLGKKKHSYCSHKGMWYRFIRNTP